ncbi:hypothetical protein K439DRAFT_1620543 [Ramaria rubella]|nr:hypothetical protein K439DRAFT_1620543 [Ramaria rubella]
MHCKGCFRDFSQKGDMLSHQKQARTCHWLFDECQSQTLGPKQTLTDFKTLEKNPLLQAEPSSLFFALDDFVPGEPLKDSVRVPATDATRVDNGMDSCTCAENALDREPQHMEKFPGSGKVYAHDMEVYGQYTNDPHAEQNPFHPFVNQMEWDVAKWSKEMQQGENTSTKLLTVVSHLGLSYHNAHGLNQLINHKLPDQPPWCKLPITLEGSNETFYLYHHNIMECIHALWGNPALCTNQMYAPQRQFADQHHQEPLHNEMNTSEWWCKTQMKLPDGATIIPIIFSSDKTQLSIFSVYMTIGNLPKAIRCKPSSGAQVLVGYLPTVDLEGSDLSSNAARVAHARLFHYAMTQILQSIIEPGTNGIMLTGGDGQVCKCFPILACYIADYPEQCLVACTWFGETNPKSDMTKAGFGADHKGNLGVTQETLRLLEKVKLIPTVTAATEFLKQCGLTNVLEPFWESLPHADIHKAKP